MSGLQLRVDKLSAELHEQKHLMQSKEKEIAHLKSSHELLQSRSTERIRVSVLCTTRLVPLHYSGLSFLQSVEDKYHAVKVLNQKLETAILSLQGRTGVSHTNS